MAEPESTGGRRSERHQMGAMGSREREAVPGSLSSGTGDASGPGWGRAVGADRWIRAERWRVERVASLAPDSASDVAGRRLAIPTPWAGVGWEPPLLWGSCQGSGRSPYRVAVDTSGPTYTCTCPSRKFPCKHVLGLLYLWAEGRIDAGGGVARYAAQWAARQQAALGDEALPAAEVPEVRGEEQRLAAERRAAQRDERVRTGLLELDRWLEDQVTAGLAVTAKPGYAAATRMAARMVDAQAPGVANRLREAALIPAGGRDWPARLLDELGRLHLLARAAGRLDELDPALRHTVRQRLGYLTPKAEVLATPPVADRWAVVGMRDSDEEQVAMRRVWLRGLATGLSGLVLLFTPPGGQADNSLLPGMVVEGDLHYYPGRPRLRALLGRRGAESRADAWEPEPRTVADAASDWRAAVAEDPWLAELPILVTGTAVAPEAVEAPRVTTSTGAAGPSWRLIDAAGDALPLVGTETDLWQLLAVTGGRAGAVFGELSERGIRPTAVVVDARLVSL